MQAHKKLLLINLEKNQYLLYMIGSLQKEQREKKKHDKKKTKKKKEPNEKRIENFTKM